MKKSDGIDIGKILSLPFTNPLIWLANIIVWCVVCILITNNLPDWGIVFEFIIVCFVCIITTIYVFGPLFFIGYDVKGKWVIYNKKHKLKRDKIRILEEKCQELGVMIDESMVFIGYGSKLDSALLDLKRYFNHVIDDIKENKEPSYYYIDELFFAKLKSFSKLKSTVKSMSNETQSKYEEIKEMLINDAKEYYKNMKEKQNSYEYSESEYLVDAVYNVFKESEEIKSVLKL